MMDVLGTAFLLSVVLLGIHSYFGIEIIKRGIIFTDLAIGQMAALGAATSIIFLDGQYMYVISLLFALFGGFLNSIAVRKVRHVEAFIGLMYALGVSGVFILLSKAAHGTEEFQKLLAADILFTPMSDIIKTAILREVDSSFGQLVHIDPQLFIDELARINMKHASIVGEGHVNVGPHLKES